MTLAETPGVRLELLLDVVVVGNVKRVLLCFCLCAHGVWPWALIVFLPMCPGMCVLKADTRPGKG